MSFSAACCRCFQSSAEAQPLSIMIASGSLPEKVTELGFHTGAARARITSAAMRRRISVIHHGLFDGTSSRLKIWARIFSGGKTSSCGRGGVMRSNHQITGRVRRPISSSGEPNASGIIFICVRLPGRTRSTHYASVIIFPWSVYRCDERNKSSQAVCKNLINVRGGQGKDGDNLRHRFLHGQREVSRPFRDQEIPYGPNREMFLRQGRRFPPNATEHRAGQDYQERRLIRRRVAGSRNREPLPKSAAYVGYRAGNGSAFHTLAILRGAQHHCGPKKAAKVRGRQCVRQSAREVRPARTLTPAHGLLWKHLRAVSDRAWTEKNRTITRPYAQIPIRGLAHKYDRRGRNAANRYEKGARPAHKGEIARSFRPDHACGGHASHSLPC